MVDVDVLCTKLVSGDVEYAGASLTLTQSMSTDQANPED